jgi:hypothetical protein
VVARRQASAGFVDLDERDTRGFVSTPELDRVGSGIQIEQEPGISASGRIREGTG